MVNKEKCLDYFEEGDYIQAIDCLDLLLSDDPENIKLLYWKASALLENEDFEESIALFDEVLKRDRNCVDAIHDKGAALMGLGKLEDADRCFDRVLNSDQNHVLGLYNKANLLYELEKFPEALKYYKKTVKLDPDYADAWYNYGVTLFSLDNFDEAITILDKTLELDQDYYDAWYFKGLSLELLGEYDEALKMFNHALELKPGESEFLISKGRIIGETGKIDEAIILFDKALKSDPENTDALFHKANAINGKGNPELALELFHQIVEIDPEYEDVWLEIGLINDSRGNKKEALSSFKKMTEINPENDLAWYNQGVMLRQLKKPQEALKCFEKAIIIFSDYADAWYLKGNVLHELNLEEKAIEAYQRFVGIVEKNDISEDKLTAKRVKEYIRMSKEGEVVSVSPPKKTQYWQWVTKAEYFLEADGKERESLDPAHGSEPGGYWTCHKDTRIGDLILLYRAGKKDGVTYQDIKYLIQAQSDAYTIDYDEYAFEHGWQYGCDYKPLFKFDNSISYHELTEDPYLEDWNALRIRFQGIAFRTEERHWKRLQELLKEKNPDYMDFLRVFKPKKVKQIAESEKSVEDMLSDNLGVLKKFGYDLKFKGRQIRCVGQGGRIDLYCEDNKDGSIVIIELKIVKATRNTFGQISNYVGWAIKRKANGRNVKGLVISKGYDNTFDMALLTNNDINHLELADVLGELGMKLH